MVLEPVFDPNGHVDYCFLHFPSSASFFGILHYHAITFLSWILVCQESHQGFDHINWNIIGRFTQRNTIKISPSGRLTHPHAPPKFSAKMTSCLGTSSFYVLKDRSFRWLHHFKNDMLFRWFSNFDP
jgi:hypothetical protein